jgi:hypothetical protein
LVYYGEVITKLKDISLLTKQLLVAPVETLQLIKTKSVKDGVIFLMMLGVVTALLTPFQIIMGFEDINGLHAGGQAEVLAMIISHQFSLSIWWRPLLIELGYMFILGITTVYLHIIMKICKGTGTIRDTVKMIAFGDAPGLIFGWIPYFATIAAVWAAVIQLFIGPIVIHQIHWNKSILVFSFLLGLGFLDIALW